MSIHTLNKDYVYKITRLAKLFFTTEVRLAYATKNSFCMRASNITCRLNRTKAKCLSRSKFQYKLSC